MTNQHIYITGGASGIGAATVRLFSKRGWKVTFSDINREWGNRLSEELGDGVMFVAADTRNREEINKAIAAGIDKYVLFALYLQMPASIVPTQCSTSATKN